MNGRKVYFVCALLGALAGCRADIEPTSRTPMLKEADGRGPWLMLTYQGEKVTMPRVVVRENKVVDASQSVYITNTGRLVTRGADPIVDDRGVPLMWNDRGQIVSEDGRAVDKTLHLAIEGRVMPSGTALRLERRGEIAYRGTFNR